MGIPSHNHPNAGRTACDSQHLAVVAAAALTQMRCDGLAPAVLVANHGRLARALLEQNLDTQKARKHVLQLLEHFRPAYGREGGHDGVKLCVTAGAS